MPFAKKRDFKPKKRKSEICAFYGEMIADIGRIVENLVGKTQKARFYEPFFDFSTKSFQHFQQINLWKTKESKKGKLPKIKEFD